MNAKRRATESPLSARRRHHMARALFKAGGGRRSAPLGLASGAARALRGALRGGCAGRCRAPSWWTRWCCGRRARRRGRAALRHRSSPTPCTPRTRCPGCRPAPATLARPGCSASARSVSPPPSCTRRRPLSPSSRLPSLPSAPSTATRPWPASSTPSPPSASGTHRRSTRAPTHCPTPGSSTASPWVRRAGAGSGACMPAK